ncbi:MAG: fructose-6-phosphate aldolase [Candidatus Sumerlaeia bacterium]|nr:fructose-6-phosphate aldolase [Candidatus Sumerlaeia bacterium]
MKFFVDTADVNEIREAVALGVVDGVTTNPSLASKTGRPFEELIREICEIVDGPISAEVVATDREGILREAHHLAGIHPNVVVKVPLIPEGIAAVRALSEEGIRTNVTLCFSAVQALLAAKAGATYISPFLGRLDDVGHVGMELIHDIRLIYDNYGFTTQILAASLRHPLHVHEAAKAGADVGTLPVKVLRQLFQHPLTDLGLEKFLADWAKRSQAAGGR